MKTIPKQNTRWTLRIIFALIACILIFPALPLRIEAQNAKTKRPHSKTKEATAAKKPKSEKWKFSFLPVGLQKNPQPEYVIITEMSDEGRKLPPPSFDKPVYYISHAIGQRDVGDSYGGTKTVEYNYLEEQLSRSLASNGYRPAGETNAATQVLFIAWGMHNRVVEPENSNDGDDEHHYVVGYEDINNLLSRARIVGGAKFADEFAAALSDQLAWTRNLRARGPLRIFSERDDLTGSLVDQIFEDCYYLLVTALDFDALRHNERKVLWTTKISTTSRGINFMSTLPNMVELGSYYFGRETEVPDILRKRLMKKATVEIGEATVQEYIIPSGTTPPEK
ncbi:MAG: hypothetical protein LBM04_04050 [Opitutaceae bacterium]|nr:hypothetical protein [Opitutaceae bacterium]